MLNRPTVSVSITSYNQRDALIRAIDSVLQQTYNNIQIVIADDFSTKDDSRDVIIAYAKKYGDQIKPILQKENVGIPRNKNTGFRACDGDYITYLDGDDFYYPNKIELELKQFDEKDNIGIVYSNFVYTNIDGQIIKQWATNDWLAKEGNIFNTIFTRSFPNNTIYRCELMRREVLKSINYYDPSIAAFHDWDSRIRMSYSYKVAYNNYIGSAYVDDPAGISKTEKYKRLVDEIEFVYQKNKPLLLKLSKKEQEEIIRHIELYISKHRLFSSGKYFNIKGFVKHLNNYPKDLFNIPFYLRFLIGEKLYSKFKKSLRIP